MSSEPIPSGAALLSRYPADKVIVDCDKCGMQAKYDKLEMLEAGGDRALTYLLEAIARRKGCAKLDRFDIKNICGARYANIQ
ncbi:hypothetical protein [Mesorhizobium amorphae]|uniref:hypothetical protein n=1 Tax=Mesorhizobium amorphae TaxID=71433 RepID=UPI00177F4133|nr:hypothetical protein [Mesorhizobium amorphae]